MGVRVGELLSAETVGDYLAERGLVAAGQALEASELGGGVSNVVLAVDVGERTLVVKQALPRLRVEDEWLAKRERAVTEGEALLLARRLTPANVPETLDVDRAACAVTIARAPREWRNWKQVLLTGEADPAVARELGRILATWHRASYGDEETAASFDDLEAFDQLRVDPYHRTVMRRRPELAPAIERVLEAMGARRRALVHGDFSPKNVLVGPDGLWIVDFEVAHYGDPDFDTAFMLNHLLLKAIHRPAAAAGYLRCARAFCAAYEEGVPPGLRLEPTYLVPQLGCLMVARVDGKSPAEYLTDEERLRALALGRALLLEPLDRLEDVWRLAREALSP